MMGRSRFPCRHSLVLVLVGSPLVLAGEGRFTVPFVTGRSGTHPFAGHPGWVDAYHAGNGGGLSARIGDDAGFDLPEPTKKKPLCLIAMFDKIETPPIIVPDWPAEGRDILIPTEYACVPPGYPEVWDRDFITRGKNFYQTIVPRGTQLYGVSFFDGPKFASWGNKVNVSVYRGHPGGEVIRVTEGGEGPSDHVSAGHSDKELPRIGWRHGELEVSPGESYAVRVGAYTHGGSHFRLDAYLRPDAGDGYPHGQVHVDGKPVDRDLCCMIFGNSHGQIVENHIRSEEWEIFIPHHRPATNWGQSFRAHGVSLAGLSFWASAGENAGPVRCRILIRPDGSWEYPIGPQKIAEGHASPRRPIIRYRDVPKPVPGYESWYELPSLLFQVAYLPDELPLEPGRTYYVEIVPDRPLLLYADGDYYARGYAYYEGLQVDRLAAGGRMTKHSERWTLAMNIVTYARKGGQPLAPVDRE